MLFLSTILFGLSSNLSLSLIRPLPLSLIYGDSTQACRPDKNPTFLMMPNLFAAAATAAARESFIYISFHFLQIYLDAFWLFLVRFIRRRNPVQYSALLRRAG